MVPTAPMTADEVIVYLRLNTDPRCSCFADRRIDNCLDGAKRPSSARHPRRPQHCCPECSVCVLPEATAGAFDRAFLTLVSQWHRVPCEKAGVWGRRPAARRNILECLVPGSLARLAVAAGTRFAQTAGQVRTSA